MRVDGVAGNICEEDPFKSWNEGSNVCRCRGEYLRVPTVVLPLPDTPSAMQQRPTLTASRILSVMDPSCDSAAASAVVATATAEW